MNEYTINPAFKLAVELAYGEGAMVRLDNNGDVPRLFVSQKGAPHDGCNYTTIKNFDELKTCNAQHDALILGALEHVLKS